jgi:hypothetical protein
VLIPTAERSANSTDCLCRSMALNDRTNQSEPAPYPSERARGGEIILRRRWQRAVFVAGLAGAVVLAFVLAMAR